MQVVDRDRNQHSDPSGAPVDLCRRKNFIRNSLLIVLEGSGDAKCSKNSKYNLSDVQWHVCDQS